MLSNRFQSSSSADAPLPTRLINIKLPGQPFVEETGLDTRGPYVALSYAWGQGRRVTTGKASYDSHKQRLPIDELPRTFADAIHAARTLGYNYLWIDALCIIQDDQDDLGRELARMGDIYRFASLTFDAQGAQSSHSGLLLDRDSRLLSPCKVTVSVTTAGGYVSRHELTLAITCNGPDYLESRGWVLQERLLSSRRLLFGEQMTWICATATARETRPVLHSKASSTRDDGDGSVLQRLRLCLIHPPTAIVEAVREPYRRPGPFDFWYAMVEKYSDKALTNPEDNLNALSGLAARFHEAQNATYVAGLWREDLEIGLAWYVGLNDERPVTSSAEVGPSWSWASVGKVRVKFHSWRGSRGLVAGTGVRVLDVASQTEVESNPFGRVIGGELTVQARPRKAILEYSESYAAARIEQCYGNMRRAFDGADATEHARYPALILDAETEEPVAEAALDRPLLCGSSSLGDGVPDPRIVVWCVLLHSQRLGQGCRGTLLVLERCGNERRHFSRLGLGFLGEAHASRFVAGGGAEMVDQALRIV
ncbi:hypothetical protein CDD83_10402 [Cordyceps sp. RAO-2017]|nr:hypothetical protein CDD83_10402 [Cordyceps sp. RAO-2017]